MSSKKKKKMEQQKSPLTELEQHIMALVLNKLIADWLKESFVYSECPEKYFENWVDVNSIALGAGFEKHLFRLFVHFLIMRGNLSGR